MESQDTVVRTDMEKGPPRSRRTSLAVPPVRYELALELSRLEMDVFEAWHHHTIADGASWFTMPLPSGRGIAVVDAIFIEAYKQQLVGENAFRVTAVLLVRNRPLMPQGELANYL